MIEHFEGTAWHQVGQPVNTYDSFLISVSAASPNDIWAVGGQSGGTSAPVLLEHYDGTKWAEVPGPALPASLTYYGWLRSVSALGPGDVWVAGAAGGQPGNQADPVPALRRHQLAGRSTAG